MLVPLLIACLTSAAFAAETECYTCHGIMALAPVCGSFCTDVVDVNYCSEVIDSSGSGPGYNTTTCDGVCQKKTTYHKDELIYVDRECVSQCEEACFLTFGTGACFKCCDRDRCNAANQMTLSLLGIAAMATGSTLGFF